MNRNYGYQKCVSRLFYQSQTIFFLETLTTYAQIVRTCTTLPSDIESPYFYIQFNGAPNYLQLSP